MIKEVTDSDLVALSKLSKAAILECVDATPAVKEEIISDTKAHIEQGLSSVEHIFLKFIDKSDAILGFILLKNGWNLSDLFVEPSAHNQGLGKQLFDEAIAIVAARENRGYIRVNSSLNAEGFYRSVGFESFTLEKLPPDFVVPLIFKLESGPLPT